MLYNGVNHWPFSSGPSLWALGLVANVFIELIRIGHMFTLRLVLLQQRWNESLLLPDPDALMCGPFLPGRFANPRVWIL